MDERGWHSMFGVVMELALQGVPATAEATPAKRLPGEDVAATLTAWWSTHALEPFLTFPVTQRLDPIDVTLPLAGAPVTFGVRFDENLLGDLYEAYAVHGWVAVEEVRRRLNRLPQLVEPTRRLLRATTAVLAVMVADALVRVEETATGFARAEWEKAAKRLDGWLGRFTVPRGTSLPIMTDQATMEKLLDRCHSYAKLRAKAAALQVKIDERNRKAPPARRRKGSGADLWFELYASPQRALLTELGTELTAIGQIFPAAALVLDDLPEEVGDLHDKLRRAHASVALSRAIHSRLRSLRSSVGTLLTALAKPPVTAKLREVVDPVRAGDTTALATLEVPDGGYEKTVLDAVFLRTEDDDQRLLADLGMLSALRDAEVVEAGSTDSVVLFRYLLTLADEVERRRISDERWATFWSVLEWIGAALGLIALLAIPLGGEAAAPALLAVLSYAATAAAVIGVVVLVLHQIIGAMQQAGELDDSVREQVFRLGQNDPEALTDIGRLMATSRALRDSVAKGALVTVLTLGAARKLRAVALALELQGFLGDLETVLAPLTPAAEPTATAAPSG